MQIPVGIMGKIVNAFVFCAIEHDTRRVHLLGITLHPTDEWIANVLRTATADGAPLLAESFSCWITTGNTASVRLPPLASERCGPVSGRQI